MRKTRAQLVIPMNWNSLRMLKAGAVLNSLWTLFERVENAKFDAKNCLNLRNVSLKVGFSYPKRFMETFMLHNISCTQNSAVIKWEKTKGTCWDECGQKGGKCPFCGKSGFCCRNIMHSTWNEDCPIEAMQAAPEYRHACVSPKKGSLKQWIIYNRLDQICFPVSIFTNHRVDDDESLSRPFQFQSDDTPSLFMIQQNSNITM